MVLFKPKWMSGNETKALAAVNRLEDEAMLCRVALACVHPRVEQAAISRIQKDKLLLQLVLSEKLSPQNRMAAAARISEAQYLAVVAEAGLAIYDRDPYDAISLNAARRLRDEEWLQDVANRAKSDDVRACARRQLALNRAEREGKLEELFINTDDLVICRQGMQRIRAQGTLLHIASHAKGCARGFAVNLLGPEWLVKYVCHTRDNDAIRRLLKLDVREWGRYANEALIERLILYTKFGLIQKGIALGEIPEVYGLLKAVYPVSGKSFLVKEKLKNAKIHIDAYRGAALCGESNPHVDMFLGDEL